MACPRVLQRPLSCSPSPTAAVPCCAWQLMFNKNRSEELKTEFLREAKILSSMNHPSVVRMFGVCEHGDNLYLVTELLEQSLQVWAFAGVDVRRRAPALARPR